MGEFAYNRFFPETAWGRIGLETVGGRLTRLWLPGALPPDADVPAAGSGAIDPAAAAALAMLERYFSGKRPDFNALPIAPEGTRFRLRVWRALREIPFGATISYGGLAARAGSPAAARAVGQAVHHNPLPILIPCHRVVAADGGLGGFGPGPELKRRLLALEGRQF